MEPKVRLALESRPRFTRSSGRRFAVRTSELQLDQMPASRQWRLLSLGQDAGRLPHQEGHFPRLSRLLFVCSPNAAGYGSGCSYVPACSP